MLDQIDMRNLHFLAAVRRETALPESARLSLRQCVHRAARRPAPAYYVSYSRVARALDARGEVRSDVGGSEYKMSMWHEISDKVKAMMSSRQLRRPSAIAMVLAGAGASSFFMSPSRAWCLYHEIMRQRRADGRRRHVRRPR